MSTEWLSARSFEQDQELISAINTLCIHLKIRLRGLPDDGRAEAAATARGKLVLFLDALERITAEAAQSEMGPLLGRDARQRQFAKSFLSERRRLGKRKRLSQRSPQQIRNLLGSSDADEQRLLVAYLEELRMLLERHIHADTVRILGEI